jgi:Na+/H+ antiporter NhaD/arsenite permease-like protein
MPPPSCSTPSPVMIPSGSIPCWYSSRWAFIDNIPYVATMLPVVQGIAGLMNGGAGFPPELFYFGLLTGATLGGNLTPIGASANIAAIGILRKQGEQVRTRDFLRIGIPFTLAAVLTGYVYLWLVWGA